MFWSVGPFWYMVYGIWYVVYGMKMPFTVYSHMFRMHHPWAAYNIVHLFLVYIYIYIIIYIYIYTQNTVQNTGQMFVLVSCHISGTKSLRMASFLDPSLSCTKV